MKKHIPNAITSLNLFCGCIAVLYALQGRFDVTTYAIALSLIFDFLDGFVARLLNVHSATGKELDSLADVISFGFVPGAIVFMLLKSSLEKSPSDFAAVNEYLPYTGFIITLFSALRLAKFNVDTRQNDSFIGLPTPANTMLFVALPMILQQDETSLNILILNPVFLCILTALMSFLLIAELPLFALKFKSFSFRGNEIRYAFLLISLLLLIVFRYTGVPLIIFLYIFISVFEKKKIIQ